MVCICGVHVFTVSLAGLFVVARGGRGRSGAVESVARGFICGRYESLFERGGWGVVVGGLGWVLQGGGLPLYGRGPVVVLPVPRRVETVSSDRRLSWISERYLWL